MKKLYLVLFMLSGLVATSQTLVPFRKANGKFTFVQYGSMETISGMKEYDEVNFFVEGFAKVGENGKGFVNTDGKEIIELKYDGATDFSHGLARVKIDTLWGFINKTGQEIIPIEFEEVDGFYEGMAAVKSKEGWGLVDSLGHIVVKPKYNSTFPPRFYEGLASVQLTDDEMSGFIDKTGKEVIAPMFDGASGFSEGFSSVRKGDMHGFIDKTGKEVIPLKYEQAANFSGGYVAVTLNGKPGYVTRSGKEKLFPQYDNIFISDGPTLASKNEKWGYINKKGKVTIPLIYENADSFEGEFGKVKLNGKWGLIDKRGKEIIPPTYDVIVRFDNTFFIVMLGETQFVIDKEGREYRESLGEIANNVSLEQDSTTSIISIDSVAVDPLQGMGQFFNLFSNLSGTVTTTTIINGDTVVTKTNQNTDSTSTSANPMADLGKILNLMPKMMSELLATGQTKDADSVYFKIIADTLVLREISGNCKDWTISKICLCYTTESIETINTLINNRASEIKMLIIENPSRIFSKLPLEKLKNLRTLSLFGNDSDLLETLPSGILSLPQVTRVILERVSLPEDEKKRISNKYKNIKFTFN